MTPTAPIRLAPPPAWVRGGLLAVVLLCVAAMHTLASHGISGSHAASGLSSTMVVAEAGMAEVPTNGLANIEAAVDHGMRDRDMSGGAVEPVGDAGSGHGLSLLELCMAVLLTTVVLTLIAWVSRWGSLPWLRQRLPQPGWVGRARAPDPPSLAELAVLRC